MGKRVSKMSTVPLPDGDETITNGHTADVKVEEGASPQFPAMDLVVQLMHKYQATTLSVARSLSRHRLLSDAEAELKVKNNPCLVVINVYQRQVAYLKGQLEQFPKNLKEGFAFLSPSYAEVEIASGSPSDRAVGGVPTLDGEGGGPPFRLSTMRTWGAVADALGRIGTEVDIFSICSQASLLSDGCDERFEEFYQKWVVDEGIKHIVGFLCASDGCMPLCDFLNERHFGRHQCSLLHHAVVEPRAAEPNGASLPAGSEAPAGECVNVVGNCFSTSRSWRQQKDGMQERLVACGLKAIRSLRTEDPEEAERWRVAHSIPFPVIVKPLCGGGSELVTLCHSSDEVRVAMSLGRGVKTSQNLDAILMVQEYITGTEYVVDTTSFNGVHVVSDVWISYKEPFSVVSTRLQPSVEVEMKGNCRRFKRDKPPEPVPTTTLLYESLAFVNNLASLCPDSRERRVVDYTLKCLDALGMRNGCAHCEVRVDERPGSLELGQPVLIELNPRMQGDTPRGTPLVGYDQLTLLVYLVYCAYAFQKEADSGLSIPWPPVPQLYRSLPSCSGITRHVVFLRSKTNGVICMRAAKLVKALPTFLYQTRGQRLDQPQPGAIATVPCTMDLFSSPGAVVLHGTVADIKRDTATLRRLEDAEFPSSWMAQVVNLALCDSQFLKEKQLWQTLNNALLTDPGSPRVVLDISSILDFDKERRLVFVEVLAKLNDSPLVREFILAESAQQMAESYSTETHTSLAGDIFSALGSCPSDTCVNESSPPAAPSAAVDVAVPREYVSLLNSHCSCRMNLLRRLVTDLYDGVTRQYHALEEPPLYVPMETLSLLKKASVAVLLSH